MNNKIIKTIDVINCLYLILSIVICVFSYIGSLSLVIEIISSISSIVGILVFAYFRWLWKVKALNFYKIPVISGKYQVTIKSNYMGIEKNGTLIISQEFLDIRVVLSVDDKESSSYSIDGAFFNDSHDRLSYIYSSTTSNSKDKKNNPDKKGAAIFEIVDGKLYSGRYWTDTNTQGDIIVKK